MMPDPYFFRLRALVLKEIRAGYGVEDIADRNGVPVDKVREAVADLRECGILAQADWQEMPI